MIRKLAILVGFMLAAATLPAAASMPCPAGADVYPYPYRSIAAPVLSDDPAAARPLGVGSIAVNYDVLGLQIKLGQFSDKVDIYVVLHIPILDPHTFFLLRPDNSLQTLGQGLVPWRKGTSGPIDERIFGDLPAEFLPRGTYQVYIVVTPEDSLASAYVWLTHFSVGGWTLQEIGAPIMSTFGEDGSFDAILYAINKGYALEQIVEAAVTQRLQANGDIIQYGSVNIELPMYLPLDFLQVSTLGDARMQMAGKKYTPEFIRNDLRRVMEQSLETLTLNDIVLMALYGCLHFVSKEKLGECITTIIFDSLLEVTTRSVCEGRQNPVSAQALEVDDVPCLALMDGNCICPDPENKLLDLEKSFSGLAVSLSGPQSLPMANGTAEGTWTATVAGGTGPYEYYFYWGDRFWIKSTEASADHVYGTPGTYNIVVRAVDTSDGKETGANPYIVQIFEPGLAYTCAVDLEHVDVTYRYADPNMPPVILGDCYRFIANGVLSGTQFTGTIDASAYTNCPTCKGELALKLDTESLRASDIDAHLRNESWEVTLKAMTGGLNGIPLVKGELNNSVSGSSGEGTDTCQLIDFLQSNRTKEKLSMSGYNCNEYTNFYVWCEER